MSDAKRDPYEVLGVPRDAEARTIKAAYFALVREHPPETHPAEFQELRDAYEVLADPERREQLDASRDAYADLGAEEAALLRAAQHAFAQDDVAGGLTMLRRLVADHPDLLVAREQLGFALLRTRAFAEAVEVWTALTQRDPRNPRHHLHLGYARQRLDQPGAAVECHRKAVELGGGDEARVALADALADAGRWEEGVGVLDERISAAGDAPPPPLVRKKVALLLLHGQPQRAWRAFNHLVNVLKGHEQERAAHAEELASLAAWLFARGKQDLANQLLRRLAALDPGRKPDRVFPSHAAVHVADLPPASRDWLEGKVDAPKRWVHTTRSRLGYLLSIVPGILLLWGAVLRATSDARWEAEDLLWTGVVFGLAAVALALGGRRFHAALTSPLPRMTLIHPAYYLQLDHDWLHVYPLINLHDVKVVRHSTNGVYTHTQVHLPFGATAVQVRFRDAGQASKFAEALLARRGRLLDLLANGLVETEPGIELVPAPLLAGGAGRRSRRPLLLGGAVAAAALGVAVAAFVNAQAAEARDWSEARGKDTPAAYQYFLLLHPGAGGRVQAALRDWVARLQDGADALPAGPGRPHAVAMVRALAAAPVRDVGLTVTIAGQPAAATGGAEPVEARAAASDGDGGRRCRPGAEELARTLTAGFQATLDRTLGRDLVRVSLLPNTAAFTLEVAVTPGAEVAYGLAGSAAPALRAAALGWALTLRAPGAAPIELRGEAAPPAAVDLPRPAPGAPPPDPDAACKALSRAQAADLHRRLWTALGLSPAPAEVLP